MKHLAFILSIFILSITVAPAIRVLHSQFSSGQCEKKCSEKHNSNKSKNSEGCDNKQGCSPLFCCVKLPIVLPSSYKNAEFFSFKFSIQNNFIYKNTIVSLPSFDIWNPPRYI